MRGTEGEALALEMHVTGTRAGTNQLQDFVWYTGLHRAKEGTWELYHPDKSGPVLQIDWSRQSATDKDLVFANVEAGVPAQGDTLAYSLESPIASMAIHDAQNDQGVPADFSVTWSFDSGAGKMHRVSGEDACWDTLANGQVDLPCPNGDWPLP